jgi:hypothetical protein
MKNQEKQDMSPQENEDIIDGDFTVLDDSSTEKPDISIDIPYSRTPEEENFELKDKVEAKVNEYLAVEEKLNLYKKGLAEKGLDYLASLTNEQIEEMRRLASSKVAVEAAFDRFDLESTTDMLKMLGAKEEEIDATVKKTHFENLIKKAMEVVKKSESEKESEHSASQVEDQKRISDLRKTLGL